MRAWNGPIGAGNAGMPPFSFQWHITDECDQRCKHCYIYAGDSHRAPERMAWADMARVIDNALRFCRAYGYRPVFFLTGGDPLLHPDFWRLAECLHGIRAPFVILGNPYHLTVRVGRRLCRLGCDRYQLSLDGREETHDLLRRPGSYRETLEAVGILKRAGLKSVIMTTVSSLNINEMPQIIDAAVAAGADMFSFARYCPTGAGGFSGIAPQAYRQMLVACEQRIREHLSRQCATRFDKKDHLWTLYDYECGRLKIAEGEAKDVARGGCHCGISHLTILPDGSVMACRRVRDSVVGNALADELADLWNGPMDAYRQYDRFQRCAGCRLLPWCRGCPAVAAGTNGSFYAPDPQCWRVVE